MSGDPDRSHDLPPKGNQVPEPALPPGRQNPSILPGAILGRASDDQVTEHYAWDTFTSAGQGHALAARTAGQFRRREALRWGLVLPGSPHWRGGLMSEAVAAVLRLGFEQMALHRVEATVMVGNTRPAALLGRAGFRREGVLRGRALHRGAFRDVWMFGLTRGILAPAAG